MPKTVELLYPQELVIENIFDRELLNKLKVKIDWTSDAVRKKMAGKYKHRRVMADEAFSIAVRSLAVLEYHTQITKRGKLQTSLGIPVAQCVTCKRVIPWKKSGIKASSGLQNPFRLYDKRRQGSC